MLTLRFPVLSWWWRCPVWGTSCSAKGRTASVRFWAPYSLCCGIAGFWERRASTLPGVFSSFRDFSCPPLWCGCQRYKTNRRWCLSAAKQSVQVMCERPSDCLVGDGRGFFTGHKCEKTSTPRGWSKCSTVVWLHHGKAQKAAYRKSRGRKGIKSKENPNFILSIKY